MKPLLPAAACAALSLATLPALAADEQKLATDKTCMSCHALDQKVLGPSFKEIAKKYADDKDASAKLATKVRKGGPIAWGGPMAMPAMEGSVSEADAKKIVDWILTLK